MPELHAVTLSEAPASLTCAKCATSFQSRVVIIRGERSHQSKKENRRTFSVRAQTYAGQEELVEFINSGTAGFELKARDTAAFSYLGSELRVVQNLTLNRYMLVSRPSCFVATCVYGPQSPVLGTLRHWRDDHLLPSALGRRYVFFYYWFGPWLVALAGGSRIALCIL